jgi:DNA-binding beta-propeller fold protein YncE
MLLPTLLASALGLAAPDDVLIVVNKDVSTVSVIALESGVALATLPTGAGPHEAAASPDGRWAVVTNYGAQQGGNTLTVVDLESRTVARTIDLGEYRRPHGIVFLPDNRRVAVTSESSGMVLLVDATTGQIVSTRPTMQEVSHMVVVAADGRRAFTANIRSGSVTAVDLVSGEPRSLAVSTQTEAIGVAPDAAQVWVGSNDRGTVTVVRTAEWKAIDTLDVGGQPYRIVFSPDGSKVLVTTPGSDEVRLFDAGTRKELGRLKTPASSGAPGQPFGVAWRTDGREAYITLRGAAQVAVVDIATMSLRRYITAGAGADGIAFARRP